MGRHCSATQCAMFQKLGGAWGIKCLNTNFPLPILLYAGYRLSHREEGNWIWWDCKRNDYKFDLTPGNGCVVFQKVILQTELFPKLLFSSVASQRIPIAE